MASAAKRPAQDTPANGGGKRHKAPSDPAASVHNGAPAAGTFEVHKKWSATAEQQPALRAFMEFLAIPSTSQKGPQGSYQRAVDWLTATCTAQGFDVHTVTIVPGKPIVVARLVGQDPQLPAVCLNSHYDVVPAVLDKWKCAPFVPLIDEKGDIYGRGTQDMKSVCVQYIFALSQLKRKAALKRTVYMTFMPDEEIGGVDGMAPFIKSDEFKKLNIGVALDEGLANDNEDGSYTLFYGERAIWWVEVRATGPTGHASRFIQNAAVEKLLKCVNDVMEFRAKQEQRLSHGCDHAVAVKLGDVVTVNLTALQAGVSHNGGKSFSLNVVPTTAMAGFDMRIPPSFPLDEFEALVKKWTQTHGCTYKFLVKTPEHNVTSLDRAKNPFWAAFEDTCNKLEMKLNHEVFPAATDGRYLRSVQIPVFGFSPMNRTPILLHDHNERLHVDTFIRGIGIYTELIAALANT